MKKYAIKRLILILTIAIIIIGIIFMGSITQPEAYRNSMESENITLFAEGLKLFKKYILIMIVSGIIAFIVYLFYVTKYKILLISSKQLDILLIFFMFIFLLLPLFIGREINGARRWIQILGFPLQPSEIIKPFLVFVLAKMVYYDKDENRVTIQMGIIMALLAIALFLERSKTSAIQISAIIFLMFSLSSYVKEKTKLLSGGILAVFGALVIMLKNDYSTNRISNFGFFNPTQTQVIASVDAIKTGGLFGRGIGNGIQKYYFLSEAHNDYIFASICEEGGFVVAMIVILLFVSLILSLLYISSKMKNTVNRLIVLGVTFSIINQFIGNIAINLNLLPSTGITLPFISYGGSSFLANAMLIGLALAAIEVDIREDN